MVDMSSADLMDDAWKSLTVLLTTALIWYLSLYEFEKR